MSTSMVLLIASLLGVVADDAAPAGSWRLPRRCGQNCLYAYLALNGRRVDLEEIERRVPLTEQGSSLADLRSVAADAGVPSRVVLSDAKGLGRWPMPAIAHLHSRDGHFVVVVEVRPDSITVADLTTGEVGEWPTERFHEVWSGYLLVRDDRLVSRRMWLALGVVMGLGALTLSVIRSRRSFHTATSPMTGRGRWLMAVPVAMVAVGLLWMRVGPEAIPVRERPVAIGPTWAREEVGVEPIEPAEWGPIEAKFAPAGSIPNLSHLVHQWENWGAGYRPPPGSDALSGAEMTAILFDGRHHSLYEAGDALVYRDSFGRPRVSRFGESGAEAHPHQLLATCAARGIESDRALRTERASATVGELVRTAREECHLRAELEWTVMVLARYAPGREAWANRWGQRIDFDALATALMRRTLGEGPCAGTNVLQALAVLLRVDAEHDLLSAEVAERVRGHLGEGTDRLEWSQRSDGRWGPDWARRLADPPAERFDDALFGRSDLALVTGHHLEWLQIAPVGIGLESESRRKAVAWCVATTGRVTVDEFRADPCAYSHCFRIARRYAAPGELIATR